MVDEKWKCDYCLEDDAKIPVWFPYMRIVLDLVICEKCYSDLKEKGVTIRIDE